MRYKFLSFSEGGVGLQPAKCFQFKVEISDSLLICGIGYTSFFIAAWPLSDGQTDNSLVSYCDYMSGGNGLMSASNFAHCM